VKFNLDDLVADYIDVKEKNYYYACRQSDIKYSLAPKKSKWNVPILFDKIIDSSPSYDNRKNQIIFNKPGTYKVTIHINFTGSNFFHTYAYLLKPHDNPMSDNYNKDRKIASSNMTIASSSHMKNHLHYSFIVVVQNALSTLVLVSVHRTNNKIKHLPDEKEITIFGKEKTWILIERKD